MTDERILRVTVGEPPKPVNGPITLVEYDPKWREEFISEARQIRDALGDRSLQIEHVGSTSVPGLVAKPIIDILLVVSNSANEESYLRDLEVLGYVLRIREPDWYEHRTFKKHDPEINLHVFSLGCVEIQRMVIFRDWLRENPADLDLYARTKKELASQNWKYVQNYADAKSKVIESIIARAHTV